MELKVAAYSCFCELVVFEINGIQATKADFGENHDNDPDNAEPYCCADMKFNAKASTPEVLEKYGITEEEYLQVCEELDKALSFGNCGWCE